MAIYPRTVIGNDKNNKFFIEKKFTDRDAPRSFFKKTLDNLQDNRFEYQVINFYGMGGIGKTALINEIKKDLKDYYENVVFSYADFSDFKCQNPATLLLELTKMFDCTEIPFYHFSFAYAIYFQKANKDLIYKQEKHEIINTDLGLVAEFFSIIDGLGILGLIPGMVNRIYDLSYNKIHLNKELKEDLQQLELLETTKIETLLPAFFAYDIKEYLKNNSTKDIVIFLDTYEALWANGTCGLDRISKDSFIRELISHLPGILFVICSREKLDWISIDPDWNKALIPYQIEKFTPDIAEEFLVKCNIMESDIRQHMINISMGLPYHLNLLVDTYAEIKNLNLAPKIELFATDSTKILQCFFKYLRQDEIATIEILSIARFYNFELFNHLISKFSTGYPITLFDEFNKCTYVHSSGQGIYHLHEIMRKEIFDVIPYELIQNVHCSIMNYYYELFIMNSSLDDQKVFVKECIYHAKNAMGKPDYKKYILSNFLTFFKTLQNTGESQYLYDVLVDVFSYINYHDSIELYEIFTDMIMLNGYFKEAVRSIDGFLMCYSIKEISTSNELLHLYVKKVKHQMIYTPLNTTIELIDNILCYVEKDEFPHQYCELVYTKCNMLLEKGEFDDCLMLLDNILSFSFTNNLNDMLCRIYRKIADCNLSLKRILEADEACTAGLEIADKFGYYRYHNYLCCTQAEIYRKLKLFDKSRELYIECQGKFYNLGINPWTAHVELALAELDIEQKQFGTARSRLQSAKNIYQKFEHEWGLIHSQLIDIRCEYLKSNLIPIEQYKVLYQKCKNLNYDSVRKELKALSNDEMIGSNILFL